jgi:hypothetical protein
LVGNSSVVSRAVERMLSSPFMLLHVSSGSRFAEEIDELRKAQERRVRDVAPGVLREHRLRGVEALALAYCAAREAGGFVPALTRYDGFDRTVLDRLVDGRFVRWRVRWVDVEAADSGLAVGRAIIQAWDESVAA